MEPQVRGNNDDVAKSFQQACYLPVMARLSFAQAEKHCVAASAHLVSVRSFPEQEFVSRISSPWQDTWIDRRGLPRGVVAR